MSQQHAELPRSQRRDALEGAFRKAIGDIQALGRELGNGGPLIFEDTINSLNRALDEDVRRAYRPGIEIQASEEAIARITEAKGKMTEAVERLVLPPDGIQERVTQVAVQLYALTNAVANYFADMVLEREGRLGTNSSAAFE